MRLLSNPTMRHNLIYKFMSLGYDDDSLLPGQQPTLTNDDISDLTMTGIKA